VIRGTKATESGTGPYTIRAAVAEAAARAPSTREGSVGNDGVLTLRRAPLTPGSRLGYPTTMRNRTAPHLQAGPPATQPEDPRAGPFPIGSIP